MIRDSGSSHQEAMDTPELALSGVADLAMVPRTAERDERITAIVRTEHDFVWRLLRRLGVPEANVDDATQQVFLVAARRVSDIRPGSERSFLFGVALRVASDRRRSREAREQPVANLPTEDRDSAPSPEELVEQRRRRQVLEDILGELTMELRTVIVLFELEQMTKNEVAEMLGIPVGTAVSRLRRAREEFKAVAERHLARARFTRRAP